jgi:hypothetical protein
MSIFFVFHFLETYGSVFCMTSLLYVSLATQLRNVEWELYCLYTDGVSKPERERWLWAEVDRLEGLLMLGFE